MNNVVNSTLKDSLEQLTRRTFDFYNSVVNQYPPSTDPLQISTIIRKFENDVRNFEEYKRCIKIVNSDARIRSLFGQLVGTIMQRSTIGSADECLLSFISRLYFISRTFDLTLFNEKYNAFEELFYSDSLWFADSARLHNFESEINELTLEDGLVIKRLPLIADQQTQYQEVRYRPYLQFSRSDFVIERKYAKPKLVGVITSEPKPEQINREMNESGDVFDLVIKALRILKSSAVYRDNAISTEPITFIPHAGVTFRTPFLENTVIGNKCVLSTKEAAELETAYNKIKQAESHQPFKIASNRLGFGLERRFDEDRLLDFMIGLESLYLPDGNDELTFRLSLRVAFSLSKEMAERKKTFTFIKKMYGLRSKIAHGKKDELTKDDITKIEELLRQSLKFYLDNPNYFTTNHLNEIFFIE